MKLAIRILVPVITFGFCLWGDISLIGFLFSKLPQDLSWLFWAKAGIVFIDIWLTTGIVIWLTVISGMIANAFTED